jgi:23S rRNA (guanosine2251-2'-O)-methyltransferase
MRRSRRKHLGEKSPGKSSEQPPARFRRTEPTTSEPARAFVGAGPGTVTLWGRHAVAAALGNPNRRILAYHCANKAEAVLETIVTSLPPDRRSDLPEPTILDIRDLSDKVPADAVHQGFVAIARPLDGPGLEDLIERLSQEANSLIVVLDQVTDPHNVGAVLRSAAAFGAAGLVVQSRHAPPTDGVLAKAASGALELVPIIEVTNIARALDTLKSAGFWCVGLSGDGETTIDKARIDGNVVLVLGAEGPGLRRLPRERCDVIARLPTAPGFATLNISNAAAIALYEVRRERPID